MSTQKSTPGPWTRGQYEDSAGYDCMTGGISVQGNVLDASNYGQGRNWDGKPWDRERMEADATLIAAAPELLEVLQEIVADEMTDFRKRLLVKAGAAIAKATAQKGEL